METAGNTVSEIVPSFVAHVVVVVGAGLAGIEVWWWDPFGAAVFSYTGRPAALFDESVVWAAG